MATLHDILLDAVNTGHITGAFGEDGILMDVYVSHPAERKVTAWYIEDGDLMPEALAGMESTLSEMSQSDPAEFGRCILYACVQEAMRWIKTSTAWENMRAELQRQFDEQGKREPEPTSYKEDIFRALMPENFGETLGKVE